MKMNPQHFDVVVIGGGAAGMMAAGRAGERGRQVLLLEKNKILGKKLGITGGGRCNITNAEHNVRLLLKNYGAGEKPLYSPFSQFGVEETFAFFEGRKLPLVVQERGRTFPKSEKAPDVVRVLENYCRENGVVIKTNTAVENIILRKEKPAEVITHHGTYLAEAVIVASGGVSHPETGSTGDGFLWLKACGHTIVKPTPGIVPLAVRDSWIKNLSGVTLEPMKITFFLNNKKQFSRSGKILFTHFGLSGPMILNCAATVGDLLHEGEVTAKIDAFPLEDEGAIESRIIRVFDENKNKTLKNIFKLIAPPGMAKEIFPLINRDFQDIKVHSVTVARRKKIIQTLKALPVTITDLMGYDRAVVADGGVDVKEIDMKTMRSRLHHNLFIVGDLLHIARPSGGYSLQLCWTTGYIAGSNV
ncbi:MAG: hypothetical protein A2817_03820 [Candidatus Yanofskybacteria bacterium RIFCSPHIGHO2_01_FULL_39_8b]|uniref:FAD-dependent oxidoreductase n=1 Tax=Candidatus Yanofskybacteria bacterium RIFCSPHIGHO2_01_FULL_39_8b TaxID=1802659 RepID=A0A1F8EFP6_9BACT|nr:MAG: hypothetical protein A2817_03820 [Candidatus Yanofskybacteria bacterium RIFCSPHIGHO2_01_FULL_39_8b]